MTSDVVKKPGSGVRPGPDEFWQLRLYVSGQSRNSLKAFLNLRRICESHLPGRYRITVIDLAEQPQRARADDIVAIPTVVRRLPKPMRTLIGNLSDTERLFAGLNLRFAD